MITSSIAEAKFAGKGKRFVRDMVLSKVGKNGKLGDLYGNGCTHRRAKKLKINILSLDDGRQNKSEDFELEMKGKDKMFMSVKNYCLNEAHKYQKINTWHLDYCGNYGKDCRKTSQVLKNAMTDRGWLFITLLCGRENVLPKGAKRKDIDRIITDQIEEDFPDFQLNYDFKCAYNSKMHYPGKKKKGSTKMICHGFQWKLIAKQK